MTLPQASIIIPHHNDQVALSHCLDSLRRCDGFTDVEIIVVDNGEPVLDPNMCKSYPNIRFLYNSTKGAADARNYGVDQANSRTLIFTDSDCKLPRDFLSKAIHAAAIHDIIGGAINVVSANGFRTNGIEAFEHVFAFNQQHYIQHKGFSVTANLVTNTKVFGHVGPFQHGVSEDYDWGQRATQCGYQITFIPELRVFHPTRSSWHALTSKWRRITAETYGIHKSRNRPTAVWVSLALLMPLSIFAHIPRVLLSPTLNTPSERLGAVSVLARIRLWRMREMMRVVLRHDSAETKRSPQP